MKNQHTIIHGQTYCGALPESVGFGGVAGSAPNPEIYYSQCGITGAILQTSEGVQRIMSRVEITEELTKGQELVRFFISDLYNGKDFEKYYNR